MNLQAAGSLIRKITSLYNNLDTDGTVTQIEKDLMRSYLRQLYELFADEAKAVEPLPSPAVSSEPVVVIPPVYVPTATPAKAPELDPPVVTPPPVAPVYAPPPIEAPTVAPAYPPPAAPVYAPPPVEAPIPTVAVTPPAPTFTPPPVEQPAPNRNRALEQLFSSKQPSDLSERLSAAPISDLQRAMSVNDRLLYMNELFGRDMKALEEATTTLNRLPNFAAAKGYLQTLGEQYDWANEHRQETAEAFIRLVQRRYA